MKMQSVNKLTFISFFADARAESQVIKDATSSAVEVSMATNQHDEFLLADDGTAGFIVKNGGELIAVFSTVKGQGRELIQIAKQCGAEYLDCFDGFLTEFYAKNGFVEVKREPNWTPGGPDVVYMKLA